MIDRGKVHQDHAVAVRGVVASLGQAGAGIGVTGGNLASSPTKRVLDPDTVAEAYWPSALELATGRWGDDVIPRWNLDPMPVDRFQDRW